MNHYKECKTPGAIYNIAVHPTTVIAQARIPFILNLTEEDAALLQTEIHDAMEQVLSRFFESKN